MIVSTFGGPEFLCKLQTCNGLVNLSKDLLNKDGVDYVLLGKFSTDPLEKMFSKLRQGSGGTYFINVQQVVEKYNILKTKLVLQLNIDVRETSSRASGHTCLKCKGDEDFVMNHGMDIIENLPEVEDNLSVEVKLIINLYFWLFDKERY